MKYFLGCVITTVSLLHASGIDAFDYYGASVSDRELPSSFLKLGMYGSRPAVDRVLMDSPAAKHGLKQGDVLLAINGKNITRASEISLFTTDKVSLTLIRGYARKTVVINRLAIESELTRHAVESKRPAVPSPQVMNAINADNSPAIRFDDAALEKKYGKTTPEQREAMRKKDLQRLQQEKRAEIKRNQQERVEEQRKKAEQEVAATAKKQQELLEMERLKAARAAEKRQWEADQRAQANYIRQQQLNDMQEKIDRLEKDRSQRSNR